MKLRVDENLSRTLCYRLADVFPGSQQVCLAGLERASDSEIWEHAKDSGFVIVTKDSDFHQMSFLFGAPPKVVWLRAGNCNTDTIVTLLRLHAVEIRGFVEDDQSAILILDH